MNAAGQVLVEYLLLASLFLVLIAGISRQIPLTFRAATPYLGGKIEQRLETGHGFSNPVDWKKPVKAKGGIRDQ